jgi:hypothetical protein
MVLLEEQGAKHRRDCRAGSCKVNFPKAETVTEITTLAVQFRAAAADLDALASEAPAVELGTLRRQAYAVRVQIANAIAGDDDYG